MNKPITYNHLLSFISICLLAVGVYLILVVIYNTVYEKAYVIGYQKHDKEMVEDFESCINKKEFDLVVRDPIFQELIFSALCEDLAKINQVK